MTLRQRVRELMVRVHRISPDLADYHVAKMTDTEVQERMLTYMRQELKEIEHTILAKRFGVQPCDFARFVEALERNEVE